MDWLSMCLDGWNLSSHMNAIPLSGKKYLANKINIMLNILLNRCFWKLGIKISTPREDVPMKIYDLINNRLNIRHLNIQYNTC